MLVTFRDALHCKNIDPNSHCFVVCGFMVLFTIWEGGGLRIEMNM